MSRFPVVSSPPPRAVLISKYRRLLNKGGFFEWFLQRGQRNERGKEKQSEADAFDYPFS
jgi:hypothetical protein